jgi:hypothetical protein
VKHRGRWTCGAGLRSLIGMVLAVTGVLMLVYPLTQGRSLGWPEWTFLLMAGAVAVLALFVAVERRRPRTVGSPLVVLSLFRARSFASGMVLWLIFWVALGGFFLVLTLYLQVGLGWTPLRAGLTAVCFAVGAAAGAGLSVQVLTPQFGCRGRLRCRRCRPAPVCKPTRRTSPGPSASPVGLRSGS